MSASNKSGTRERIVVDSIRRVKISSLQNSVTKKNLVFNSPFSFMQLVHTPNKTQNLSICPTDLESTNSLLILTNSGSYQLCKLSRITDCQ